jgi:hypothetical protein
MEGKIMISKINIRAFMVMTCLLLLFDDHPGYGQLTTTPTVAPSEQTDSNQGLEVKDKVTLTTLRGILQSIVSLQNQIKAKESELELAQTEEQKTVIANEMNDLLKQIDLLKKDFESVATGIDIEKFMAQPAKIFDWREQIQEIIGPIIEELKAITARPRELEKLRSEVAYYEKRLLLVNTALENVQKRINQATARLLKNQLSEVKKNWENKKKDMTNQLAIAQYQLEEKQKEGKSLVKSTQEMFRDFFKSRGLNLILALFAFFSVFFLLRYLYRVGYKYLHLDTLKKRPLFIRLADVIYHILTFLGATIALLLVLYISGDWVLLGIALIFLFSIAWTMKQTFPMFWEQIKFLLNLGTVREGERVMYNGLPWKVISLQLYTKLHNPALKGGLIRLPLRELIGLQSRPFHKDEPWFPSREGDLVVLTDGGIGKVILQTPEQVVIDTLGGCHKTYPTLLFLQQNPINCSINTFGIFVTFGIDYAHQANITHDIPERLHQMLTEALQKEEYGKELLNLVVQFKEAAASSLNLFIAATFSGQVATSYYPISRALQRMTVEACNKYGWNIPFTQITVHTAKPPQLQDHAPNVGQRSQMSF